MKNNTQKFNKIALLNDLKNYDNNLFTQINLLKALTYQYQGNNSSYSKQLTLIYSMLENTIMEIQNDITQNI